MSNLELMLKIGARDQASRVVERASQSVRSLQRVNQAREGLGIRSEKAIQNEIKQTIAQYNRLAKSGTASAREIARAQEAARQKVRELNAEMGKTSVGQRALGAGKAVAGVVAGAMVAKQVLTPAMDDQKQWDANVTNVALQAFGDKDADYIKTTGIDQIQNAVKEIVNSVGGKHDDALGNLNAMMVNGMDFETAKALLPKAQMMQVAGEASSDDIGALIKVLGDYGFKGEEVSRAFEHALRSGMDGKFEIADMVRELPSVLSKASAAGFHGMKDFDYLLAWLQSAADKAGTNGEAANNVGNTLEKVNAEDTKKRLSKLDNPTAQGKTIDWNKTKQAAVAKGANVVQALEEVGQKMLEVDKGYQTLKKQLSQAKTGEERERIQAQMSLKQGEVFSQLLPDVQAKAGLTASADKQAMKQRMENSQNEALTNQLNYKRYDVVMSTDKARDEQRQSQEFINGKLSSTLTGWERQWNDFWLNTGKENPEMLGVFGDVKLGLGAVAAAAGVAAAAMAALGGKDALSSVADMLGGKGGIGGKGRVGGGKGGFGGVGKWAGRSAGIASLAMLLTSGSDEETQKAVEIAQKKSNGTATREEKTWLENRKQEAKLFDARRIVEGGNLKSWLASDEEKAQARRLIEEYEAKQKQPAQQSGVLSQSANNGAGGGLIGFAQQMGTLATQQNALEGKVGTVEGVLSNYQGDFKAFGQSISTALEAGLASQSHTIANQITVELDGAIVAEKVAEHQFNFNKRMN